MSRVEPLLKEFIEDHLGSFINHYKVGINYDGYVIVSCSFPNYHINEKNIFLELISCSTNLNEFIQTFNLKSVADIELIDKMFLYSLYLKGKAEVVCVFDGYCANVLYFKKKGNKLYARDEEHKRLAVPTLLDSAEAYIHYTKQHFCFYDR